MHHSRRWIYLLFCILYLGLDEVCFWLHIQHGTISLYHMFGPFLVTYWIVHLTNRSTETSNSKTSYKTSVVSVTRTKNASVIHLNGNSIAPLHSAKSAGV
eukprot:TRINITY_DN457_c0_g1_i3.p1 TRINITY_DN457_c0_g1~~TRINITY_DN457_c0_g1_i3.p1  ORF type:complete len:100 (-),score=4.09 TRINITY_DN457_c0_g1_i3:247-546(-)